MSRGNKVFSKLGAFTPSAVQTGDTSLESIVGVNDIFLYSLFARIALSNNETLEFETVYDKATDTIELIVPDQHLDLFDQLTGMQRGSKFRTFINWLIGSQTLEAGATIDRDPTFVSVSAFDVWAGATVNNLDDQRIYLGLPATCLSTFGYNTKVDDSFVGGNLRITLVWLYEGGSNTSFDVQTTINVTDISSGSNTEYVAIEQISTFNLVNGDVRETEILLVTDDGISPGDLISVVLRRNWDTTTEPATDLVGVLGIKFELEESE